MKRRLPLHADTPECPHRTYSMTMQQAWREGYSACLHQLPRWRNPYPQFVRHGFAGFARNSVTFDAWDVGWSTAALAREDAANGRNT